MVDPFDVVAVPSTAERIRTHCLLLSDMMVAKNAAYGDSALHPTGIFAQGKASELIKTRIDDKLNRIKNNPGAFGEDPVWDLEGYLVLLAMALEDEKESA